MVWACLGACLARKIPSFRDEIIDSRTAQLFLLILASDIDPVAGKDLMFKVEMKVCVF